MMKLSRRSLPSENVKRDKETIIADNIAEKLCKTDNRDFWKYIKHLTTKKVKFQLILMVFSATMTLFQCGNNITQPYLIVLKKSSCDQAHSDFCNTNIAFDNGMSLMT